MRKLLPFILSLAGLGAGLGAGLFLRPPVEGAAPADVAKGDETAEKAGAQAAPAGEATESVKLSSQFLVPVLEGGRVTSLVILTLSLEVPPGGGDQVLIREPLLRDALLQVMFDHSNTGGFSGSFTETAPMQALRRALLEAAQGVLGQDRVSRVSIVDIVRQDA